MTASINSRGGGDALFVRRGGSGAPTLLLLHGLGGSADVWTGLIELLNKHWSGSWIAPDLPGHGRSPRLPRYTYGAIAEAVAAAIKSEGPLAIVGHSLGGVIGMMLASERFDVDVTAVCGIGVKPDAWPRGARLAATAMAALPQRSFWRINMVAGRLVSIVDPGHATSPASPSRYQRWQSFVRGGEDQWAQAVDQRVFAVGPHHMAWLLAECRAPVLLAGGEHDPVCNPNALRAFDHTAQILPAEGHEPHLDNPQVLLPLIDRLQTL
jgi:pimeloyl-ACP methyl ester carboxylesterase